MSLFDDAELDDMLRIARATYDVMTPEQKLVQRREHHIDFAFGNLACSTNHRVSREVVERAYARMHPEERCSGAGKHWRCGLFVGHPGSLHSIVGPYHEE